MPEQDPIEQRIAEYRTKGIRWNPGTGMSSDEASRLLSLVSAYDAALRKAEQERDAKALIATKTGEFIGALDYFGELSQDAAVAWLQEHDAKLKQERDEARRRSARLDWLESVRSRINIIEGPGCSPTDHWMIWGDEDDSGFRGGDGATIYDAIDAAMSAHKAEPDVLE